VKWNKPEVEWRQWLASRFQDQDRCLPVYQIEPDWLASRAGFRQVKSGLGPAVAEYWPGSQAIQNPLVRYVPVRGEKPAKWKQCHFSQAAPAAYCLPFAVYGECF